MEKFYPKVGDQLYLSQQTGNSWVDMVKYPYTVVEVTKNNVFVQEAELIFDRPRYYDTVASEIRPDPNGHILKLNWAPKRGRWQIDRYQTGYPEIATFGKYEHQPYLN